MILRILILSSVPNIINVFLQMVIICMLPVFGIKCSPTKIWIYLLNKNYWLNTDVMKFQMYSIIAKSIYKQLIHFNCRLLLKYLKNKLLHSNHPFSKRIKSLLNWVKK